MATDYAVHHLDRVASTQDEARVRFDGRPCLVTAQVQTAGRGRGGASWANADRALAASLALTLDWPTNRASLVPLVAGLEARAVLGPDLRLKWPNDVVTQDGSKVAGLLVEHADHLVVIGLGVNLFWSEPVAGAGAVYEADPGVAAARRAGEAWAHATLNALDRGPGNWNRAGYLAVSATIGRTVTWEGGGPARAIDIAEDGGLVVENGGRRVLRSGRVHTVRPATLTD